MKLRRTSDLRKSWSPANKQSRSIDLSICQHYINVLLGLLIAEMVLTSTSAKVAQSAVPIGNLFANSCKEILDSVGDARVVLLGEATHGTEEFYERRADITKALIEKKGFQLVLCESDFPPFFHLNRWINKRDENYASMTDKEKIQEAIGAMKGLKDRFPVWMWYDFV